MPVEIRVLIVEDNPADAELMAIELRSGGFIPMWRRVETQAAYLSGLAENPCVILCDYNLPVFDAPRALQLLQERELDIPFIVVSGAIGEEVAVDIMRAGASDYLLKDRLSRLPAAVAAVLEKKRLREEKRRAEEAQRQAEQRYRDIFENSIEGIFQRTSEGQILAANPAAARMLGYSSPEEAVAEIGDARDLHVDTERLAEYERLLQERDSIPGFECRLRRKDGSVIWVSLNTRVMRDASGRVLHHNSTLVDITELKATEAALDQYRQDWRDLAARLLTTQETESKRLGRELHDAFSQRLAVLGIEVGLLRRIFEERVNSISGKISELAKDLHQTSRRLHPAVLYSLGLHDAATQLCDDFARDHGIPVKYGSANLPEQIQDEASLCIYRVLQESLWNIRRHANASEVSVTITGADGRLVMSIEDDGCGFVRNAVRGRGGLGLVSMEERVRLVGGTLTIDSKPGFGTRIQVSVPLNVGQSVPA